jgi:hypothetical protein
LLVVYSEAAVLLIRRAFALRVGVLGIVHLTEALHSAAAWYMDLVCGRRAAAQSQRIGNYADEAAELAKGNPVVCCEYLSS